VAKWGDGWRWHGGTLWGGTGVASDPFSGDVVWIVNIDWAGTGAVNESDYTRNIDIKRGREHYINTIGSGFERMRPGRASILMDNSSGRFDPYNTASALYPNVLPGRKVQISVYDVATKITHVRFTGHITDIQPSSGINEVTITCEDGMRWLADADYSSGVIYAKTTSEAINLVLSFVNWPYARNIQTSLQPLQVFEPGNGAALDIIQELAEANLGVFFIDRFGNATFYPVSYTTTTSHSIDQSTLLREIRIKQPWETIRNKIRVIANRKGKRPASAIWTMAGVETFATGESKTFGAQFSSADSLTVQTLTANTLSNGAGADVSGNFTVGKTSVTATECTLTVTNGSGAAAYLLALRLVGNAIVSAPEVKASDDTTSIATYGPRSFVLDNTWLQDRAFAAAYATMLKNHLKVPHKDPIIQIQERPSIQHPIDLYDKVVLGAHNLGIESSDSTTFTVGGIDEKWLSDTGQSVVTTLYLQTVLYDNTVITPDPFDPGALPDVPFPDTPYWYDPYTPSDPYVPDSPDIHPDPTNACLAVGAFATVPAWIKPVASPAVHLTATNLSHIMYYPCTLRPANALNKSYLAIHMDSFTGGNPTWTASFTTNFLKVTAIDAGGADICNSTLTVAANGMNTAYAWFLPPAAIEVAGFKVTKTEWSGIAGIESSDYTSTSDGYIDTISPPISQWVTGDGLPEDANAYKSGGKLYLNGPPNRSWRWYPPVTMAPVNAVSYASCWIFGTSNDTLHWFPVYTDGYWPIGTQYVAVPVNEQITCYDDRGWGYPISVVNFSNQAYSSGDLSWINNIILGGWTLPYPPGPSESMIYLYDMTVSNVCATGIL
jgi:hypothetical protein